MDVRLAAFPLQATAWLLRGLIFQYLGLTALVAYLTEYPAFLADSRQARATSGGVPQVA